MDDGVDIRDHFNYFTKLITQLSRINMKVDDEDKALLLSSLLNYYESLIITLLVGKETLKVDDVIVVFLKNDKLKNSNDQFEGCIFIARSNCSRSMSCGSNFGKDNSRSSSMSRENYKDK